MIDCYLEIDVVFVVSDYVVLGVMWELVERERRVLEDVVVVGFSNEGFGLFVELSLSIVD